MKVLLIDPPFYEEAALGRSKGSSMRFVQNVIPSLGLAYIAAVLEKKSHKVRIIDCTLGITYDRLQHILTAAEKPDIVGITATTPTFGSAKIVAGIIRAIFKDSLIVIGGVHVTSQPEQTLKEECFDIAVLGEGEYTFLELSERFFDEGPGCFPEIKGLAYRIDSKLIINERRPFIQNLDELPFPARHLLPPISVYRPTPASYKRLPVGVLMSSRGCPYHCTFCDRSVFGTKYRMRSVDNILDEVEELIHKYGAREIRFFDDTITIDKKKLFELVDKMKKRKIRVSWTAQSRVDAITPDTLKKLKEGGCWQLLIGIESADDRMLKVMNKGVTAAQNARAVELMNKYKMGIRADFLVGVPGETKESLNKSLNFVLMHNIDYVYFNKFVPFSGVELTRILEEKGYKFNLSEGSSILDIESNDIFVPDTLIDSEYRDFLKKVHKKFYLRPSYILRRLFSIRTFDQLLGHIKGFFAIRGI
jgi:radical SAM superfamily enzyme YgiQ (UPF0313 family)